MGTHRIVRLARYLPRCGWEPVVLATQYTSYPYLDWEVMETLPQDIRIHRAFSLECLSGIRISNPKNHPQRAKRVVHPLWKRAFRRFFQIVEVPDDKLDWVPFAYLQARKIRTREPIKVAFSSGGPFSTHLVGLLLKRIDGIPWVADFRDPWVRNPYIPARKAIRYSLESFLERQVVTWADRVTVVSPGIKALLEETHPELDPSKVIFLPSCFDEREFDGKADPGVLPEQEDRFLIAHVGSFYRRRTPRYFLEALQRVFQREPKLREKVRVLFVGELGYDEVHGKLNREYIREFGLEEIITWVPYLSHRESLAVMKRADLLLLIGGDLGETDVFVPGKLAEYLAAGRPIMAMLQPGPAAEIVERSRRGIRLPVSDVDLIAQRLEQCIHGKYLGKSVEKSSDRDLMTQFKATQVAHRLASEFDQLVDSPSEAKSNEMIGNVSNL